MNLAKRTAALIRQKQEELDTLRRDIARLQATQALKLATQYALDFAAPEESVIVREELAHDMAEDLSLALELEEGEVSRLIEEAIASGELERYGDDRLIIPTRTFVKAKLTS